MNATIEHATHTSICAHPSSILRIPSYDLLVITCCCRNFVSRPVWHITNLTTNCFPQLHFHSQFWYAMHACRVAVQADCITIWHVLANPNPTKKCSLSPESYSFRFLSMMQPSTERSNNIPRVQSRDHLSRDKSRSADRGSRR